MISCVFYQLRSFITAVESIRKESLFSHKRNKVLILSHSPFIHRDRSTDWRRGAYIQSGDLCGARSMQLKILKFRLCESAFEAVGDHYNHAKLECNSGDSSHGCFSKLLPFGISLCIWGTATELSLRSCRFECSMFIGHKAVIEMCAAPKYLSMVRVRQTSVFHACSVPKGLPPPPVHPDTHVHTCTQWTCSLSLSQSPHKDTVQVVVFDVDKGDLVMNEDWRHCALLLCLEHHREELVNHWHVHITTIVPWDQGLLTETPQVTGRPRTQGDTHKHDTQEKTKKFFLHIKVPL